VDQHGQVIDVVVSTRRDGAAARAFFVRALRFGPAPVQVTTDRAPVYPRVIDELVPAARHITEQYANNVVEADHGRLKARLRPMRGLKRLASARTVSAGHAFVQNLRRGHYELTVDVARMIELGQHSTNSQPASDCQQHAACHPARPTDRQRNRASRGGPPSTMSIGCAAPQSACFQSAEVR
jgi:hypothetical protein